jgi:hypothetical protein
MAKEPTRWASVFGGFVFHASVAMLIGPAGWFVATLTAVLLFRNSSSINSVLNAGGVLNPLLWGPGLLLGMLVNRFTLGRTACWVWLAGMVWTAYGIYVTLFSYHVRFDGICSPLDNIASAFLSFVSNYCGGGENVVSFTLPTFSSISYSLGAWIILRWGLRGALASDRAKT